MCKCVQLCLYVFLLALFVLFVCFVPFRCFVCSFCFCILIFYFVCLFLFSYFLKRVWIWVAGEVWRIWKNLGEGNRDQIVWYEKNLCSIKCHRRHSVESLMNPWNLRSTR